MVVPFETQAALHFVADVGGQVLFEEAANGLLERAMFAGKFQVHDCSPVQNRIKCAAEARLLLPRV